MSKIQLTDDSKVKVREVILKSLNDASFKERLVKNPKAAIAELYPDLIERETRNIVVFDQTDKNTIYVNVSATQYVLLDGDPDAIELTQEDLNLVAGGKEAALAEKVVTFYLAKQRVSIKKLSILRNCAEYNFLKLINPKTMYD